MAIMTDGFSTTINIAGVELHEKTVTPPTLEGGGANDTTTMRNTKWRTKFPKKLISLGEATFTAAWDPAAYDALLADLNVNQEIVITFPDGDTLTFWGWVDNAAPGANEEGSQPEMTVTIIASNMDSNLDEIDPVFVAGT